MNIQDIQRKEKKSETISIRTSKAYSKWMKDNRISPTALFNKAVKELIENQK